MTTARLAAAEILLALEGTRTTLGAELERGRVGLGDLRDRGLLVELATGALRWRSELDALIVELSRRPVADLQPAPLAVLRLGLYQLRHLERVPAHAVVHESVETVRALGAPRAAGLVNAVLRQAIRQGTALALPPRPDRSLAADREAVLRYLSVTLSHPEWVVARWLDRYGFDATEQWCRFNNAPPPVTVRSAGRLPVDELLARLHAEGLDAAPAPVVADALRLQPGMLGRVSAPLRAELVVQDEGAQLVARVVGAAPGERVLDMCAAPGGKTIVCAADMALRDSRGSSLLVAADFRRARVAMLARTLGDLGLPVPVVRLDGRHALPFDAVFDAVILDAPCSGLGTLRRDPDLKWSRAAEDLPRMAREQTRLLHQAAAVVAPGGRLVYATCSSEPEENTAVVEAFLAAHTAFRLEPANRRAPLAAPMLDAAGCLATTPFRDGMDAFFAAVLVRSPAA